MNQTEHKTEKQFLECVRQNNNTNAIGLAKNFKDLNSLKINNALMKKD